MNTEYFVSFGENGLVRKLFTISENEGNQVLQLITGSGSFRKVTSRREINRILKNSRVIDKLTFEFFKSKYFKGESCEYMGKPVTKNSFDDPTFLEVLVHCSLQYNTESKLSGQWKVEELVKPTLSKMKTKYTLYHGDREIITGYSKIDSEKVSERLYQAISEERGLIIHGENDRIIAFYNAKVTGDLSFSITSLE